jgi:hypothetical protein
LEIYGENLEGRCSLFGPPRAYLRIKESAVKENESQVTEKEEPARIPDECQREEFNS